MCSFLNRNEDFVDLLQCEAIPKGENHLHTPKSFVYAVDEDIDVGLEDMPSDFLAEFMSSTSLGEEEEKSSFRCVRAATAAVSSMLSSPSSTHGRTSRPAPTTTATATTIESSRLVVRVQRDANVLALLREVPDLVEPTKIVEAVRKVRLCMVTHADMLSMDCVNTLPRPDGTVASGWLGLRSPPEP
ncbi:hypothetical protein PC119_g13325 [Phytophthora cactorum]|nr:hypothetical protein PC119_g13325 [Phytophthora cactorum]